MLQKAFHVLACLFAASFMLKPLPAPAAAVPSCTVPLVLTDIKNDPSNPEYKLGIYVGLGGGAPMLYEFDTGGQGFWAAFTKNPPSSQPQWWGSHTLSRGVTLINQYTSGNHYTANLATTTIALYAPEGNGFARQCETPRPVGVAQITRFSNRKTPGAATAWRKALAHGQPPLFNHFYGDFGAALSPVFAATPKKKAIFSALPQFFPSKTANGFIVRVGPLDQANPSLTLGIDDSVRQDFPIQLPMNPYCKTSKNPAACAACQAFFPDSDDTCAFSEQITNARLDWTASSGLAQSFDAIGLTLDTGAPSATIWQNRRLSVNQAFLIDPVRQAGFWNGDFGPGTTFRIAANSSGGVGLSDSITTGNTKSVDKISAATRPATSSPYAPKWSGYLNTGLMFYTRFDVMFDLEYGVVRLKPLAK